MSPLIPIVSASLSMRDNDDLGRLPPMVPERDDVDSHLSNRKAQGQDIVMPARGIAQPRSSAGLKAAIAILFLAVFGGAGYGYFYTQEANADARSAELRIADLERRLSLVGDSAEESTLKMIERMDFNFSEIDKLWAARRVLNGNIDELKGEAARIRLTIQASLNSGDSTVLGLAGRLDYVEQSMESVNAYRLQVNDSLYRLQQNVETLQSMLRPAQ